MFFVSTRNSKVIKKFKDAVLQPMAEQQGGIFTPSFISPLDYKRLFQLSQMSYPDALAEITDIFAEGYIDKATLHVLANKAFENFGTGYGAKLGKGENLAQGDKYFSMCSLEEGLEMANLTSGPTGCVKDYGYDYAAEIINHLAKKYKIKRTIIDSSGGSSGPSTAYASRNKEWLKAFTLLRIGKNTSVPALMKKAEAPNLSVAMVEADHNFVNDIRFEVSNNTSLRELENMTFINELNIINIIAYIPAFIYSYIRCNSKPFCVSVPTANMSLAMSAFLAIKLGVPIKKIILCVEKNNFLHEMQESKVAINNPNLMTGCTSLHSNIPTNFERILFYLYESNQQSVKMAMEELESNGRYKMNDNIMKKFSEYFYVANCDNQFTIRNTIYSMVRERNIPVDQHFAIAKMGVDIATSALGTEISNLSMVVFNTLDYRRNMRFVNDSLGYDMEAVEYPYTEEDINGFSATTLTADVNFILKYMLDELDNQGKPKENTEEKKEEEKK